MNAWPQNPSIYEINTWVWLGELGRRYKRPVTLADVPPAEWDALAALHIDAVWLMGVWQRSPLGARIASENAAMTNEFRQVLPDYQPADNVGSPYCVKRYVVDDHLGGPDGLARAREALASRGMRLILDYVPNHVALDHPAVSEHPEFFIQGTPDDLARDPAGFFEVEGHIIARGRDPNFPPWPDVAQLNAFSPQLREGAIEAVSSIASQCDGMRCDMAMLMMDDVFKRTWGDRAGDPPPTQFWPEIIGAVKRRQPGTLFIAEAYWDLEYPLQQQGFDYCYDKRLYDRLLHEGAESITAHLQAGLDYQRHLVRFIENHDEPRAASALGPDPRERAAAVVSMTLPGCRLVHEGQPDGRTVHLPVFLRRAPDERPNAGLQDFYQRLLDVVGRHEAFKEGNWQLCERRGWDDNDSFHRLVAWAWYRPPERFLEVVNLSDAPAQGRLRLPWPDLENCKWQMTDEVNRATFAREGDELAHEGLYVDLQPWQFHLLQMEPAPVGV